MRYEDTRFIPEFGDYFRRKSKLDIVIADSLDLRAEMSHVAALLIKIYAPFIERRERHFSIWFGNGGSNEQSAGFASHFSTELSIRYSSLRRRPALPAIALTDPTALSAESNDFGYAFARQLEGIIFEGDVAVGISTSGKSQNVTRALRVAKEKGASTVAFTGMHGMEGFKPDYTIRAPSDETSLIQEAHLAIGHEICNIVDREIAKIANGSK